MARLYGRPSTKRFSVGPMVSPMGVCQVGFIDVARSEAHVVEISGYGGGSNMITVCRRVVLNFGQVLPSDPKNWAAQDAPWCAVCMAALG